jgi:hypothetical protein
MSTKQLGSYLILLEVDPKVQLFVDILVQPVNIGQQGVEVILKRKRRKMKIIKKKISNFTTLAKGCNKIIISYLAPVSSFTQI